MAAGLGFKTFNTGDVLSAADTNGYLMQGVLVFASAAARDAAITSPQEGQCCYLKDTDAVLTYSGAAWVGFDDSNAIQNTIVDAKGDIVAASGSDTPARLAVGNNGETLVADSSQTTGLAYREDYAAGKNKIINGDFRINQRNFTSVTTDGTYGFDRWNLATSTGSTYTPQTFTAGAAPVTGYEGTNFAQLATTGQVGASDLTILIQKIEDVRTFANQTVTVSFWAKAASGTPKVAVEIKQGFGSGGSADVNTYAGQVTLTTAWVRYSVSILVPSISGKTIGTSSSTQLFLWTSAGSTFNSRTGSLGLQNATIAFWGVQVEDGSVATAFNTATGTLQGELAACQRYYYRLGTGNGQPLGLCQGETTNIPLAVAVLPVTMRTGPTLDQATGTNYYLVRTANANNNFNSFTLESSSTTTAVFYSTGTIVSGAGGRFTTNNASSYLGFSAEL